MTQNEIQKATAIAGEHGIAVEEYGLYSGRGMFGAKTLALTVDSLADIGKLARLLGRELSSDNLGRQYIAY